jgi:3-carboxy-cis,cis-muconate cycloisomerase
MSSRLLDCLATTDALAEVFSDASVLQAMLDFEAAVARAGAATGIIPTAAARTIAEAARAELFDPVAIARAARAVATPAIPLVNALTEHVRGLDEDSARYVHWGATSQDVTDTAMVLLLKRARTSISADYERIEHALKRLSDRHAGTIMLGRTLLQPATPITLGLKAARWRAAIVRSWNRLDAAWDAAMVIQFGGAAGTLAALREAGSAMNAATAAALGLRAGPPWHTDRDLFGAVVTGCGLFVAALGKVARDIALLMQAEVAEAAEPGGGSSTMPQKQNPSGCALVLAAAGRMPGVVASFLSGMIHEHERAVGGIQSEWPVVAAAVQLTGAAAAALAAAVDGLAVNPARMRANLDATGGTIFAERAVMLMAPSVGREAAQQLVTRAISQCRQTGQPLAAVLESMPDVSAIIPSDVLAGIDRPEQYLGASEELRALLLDQSEE